MEEKDLRVTVIALAYKRKKFLNAALDSVLENSIVPDQIILVKCFIDVEFDAILESRGIEIHNMPDTTKYGDMLVYALNKASGDIIMLIEDDDMFLPSKIETLKAMFEKNSDLIAIKDMPETYKGYGNFSDFVSISDYKFSVPNSKTFKFTLPINDTKEISELNKLGFSLNPSTMSFRRNFIMDHLDILECNDPLDVMLGLAFLVAHSGTFSILQRGCTVYRIHDDNDSRISSVNKETIDRMLSTSNKYLQGLSRARGKVLNNIYAVFFTDSIIFRNKLICDILKLNGNLSHLGDLVSLFKQFNKLSRKNKLKNIMVLKYFIGFVPLSGTLIYPFSIFSKRLVRLIYLMRILD